MRYLMAFVIAGLCFGRTMGQELAFETKAIDPNWRIRSKQWFLNE